MKLKISDLMAFIDSYQSIKDNSLPFTLSYQLSRINKEVLDCVTFYQTSYNACLQQYAKKKEDDTFEMGEDGNSIILKEDTLQEARQKFYELDNTEFPLDVKKIPLSAFQALTLSPKILSGLLPFIDENG